MPNIFISYARIDLDKVQLLRNNLDELGYNVWFDRPVIKDGLDWWESVRKAIQESSVFLYVLTSDAITSDYVQSEFEYASRLHKPIISIIFDSVNLNESLPCYDFIDFTEDYINAINELHHKLKWKLTPQFSEKRRDIWVQAQIYQNIDFTSAEEDPPENRLGKVIEQALNEKSLTVDSISEQLDIESEVIESIIEGLMPISELDDDFLYELSQVIEVGYAQLKSITNMENISHNTKNDKLKELSTNEIGFSHNLDHSFIQKWNDFKKLLSEELVTIKKAMLAYHTGLGKSTLLNQLINNSQALNSIIWTTFYDDYNKDHERILEDLYLLSKKYKFQKIEEGFHQLNYITSFHWCSIVWNRDQSPKNSTSTIFMMTKYPVTYHQYQQFIDDRDGYNNKIWWKEDKRSKNWHKHNRRPYQLESMNDDLPKTYVNWYEAVAFCVWLTHMLSETYSLSIQIRLPTKQEWKYAARGLSNQVYPWGDIFDSDMANTFENKLNSIVPVGSYPQNESVYGVRDMSGNIWEWCDVDPDDVNRFYPQNDEIRVLQGGSFKVEKENVAIDTCREEKITHRSDDIGFRLVCIISLNNNTVTSDKV